MKSSLNEHYNTKLKKNANKLRHSMTKAEACLWKYVLNNCKLSGYQFRRQRPVLNYIADFMCKELKLIIEVDGYTHTFENNFNNDKIRTAELENHGFRVIRFSDNDILGNIEGVKMEIERVVGDILTVHPLPPPAGDTNTIQTHKIEPAGDTNTIQTHKIEPAGDTNTIQTYMNEPAGDTNTIQTYMNEPAGNTNTIQTHMNEPTVVTNNKFIKQ